MTPTPRARWWPAVLIVLLTLAALAVIWRVGPDGSDPVRQFKVMRTGMVFVVASSLLLLWLTFFSRLPWRKRLGAWGILLVLAVLFKVTFRFRGVSGDLVPIFEPRWAGKEAEVRGESLSDLGSARDYPQFLGPSRNATVKGVRLARDWSTRAPKLLWRRPVREGWASFAVVGNAAVTQEQRSEQEVVVRYDLKTGEERWVTGDPVRYQNPVSGVGPRSTPTIHDGRVYASGATGRLNCLDLETGSRIWSRDVVEENDGNLPQWGKSCSPLVVEDLVVVSAGGANGKSLVAYQKETGEIVWQAGDDRAGYSSPLLATLAGLRQIVIFNHSSVVGHDPADGRVLWSHPWPDRQPNVAQPMPLPGDRLLVSSGYGVGSKLLEIRPRADGGLEAVLVWESLTLKAKFANAIFHDGFVYGLDDGILVCLDPTTGKRRWKRGRYGHGQMILVEDLLLVQTEQGEVVLIEPDPEELRELGRLRVVDGKLWNSPTLVGRYLLIRSDREAALFELPTL